MWIKHRAGRALAAVKKSFREVPTSGLEALICLGAGLIHGSEG